MKEVQILGSITVFIEVLRNFEVKINCEIFARNDAQNFS